MTAASLWCCHAWRPVASCYCTTFLLPAVAGIYAQRILRDTLGVDGYLLLNCEPKPDFGGHHPDPNLTYASELVAACGESVAVRDTCQTFRLPLPPLTRGGC